MRCGLLRTATSGATDPFAIGPPIEVRASEKLVSDTLVSGHTLRVGTALPVASIVSDRTGTDGTLPSSIRQQCTYHLRKADFTRPAVTEAHGHASAPRGTEVSRIACRRVGDIAVLAIRGGIGIWRTMVRRIVHRGIKCCRVVSTIAVTRRVFAERIVVRYVCHLLGRIPERYVSLFVERVRYADVRQLPVQYDPAIFANGTVPLRGRRRFRTT